MSNVTVSRTIPASPQAVWALLSDFGSIERWSAAIERSPINPGTPDRGVGAERHCHLYDGNHIQERVVEVVDLQRLGIEVIASSMPLASAHAVFVLTPTGDGGTEVTMTWDYVVKFGILGRAMDAMMLNRSMTGSLSRLLAGLEHHVVTGERVEKGWSPAAAAA